MIGTTEQTLTSRVADPCGQGDAICESKYFCDDTVFEEGSENNIDDVCVPICTEEEDGSFCCWPAGAEAAECFQQYETCVITADGTKKGDYECRLGLFI